MNTSFADTESFLTPELNNAEDFTEEDNKEEKESGKKQRLYNARARRKIEMYLEEKRLENMLQDFQFEKRRATNSP